MVRFIDKVTKED